MITSARVFFTAIIVSIMAEIFPSVMVILTGMVLAWYAMAQVDRKALAEPGVYFGVALLSAFVF